MIYNKITKELGIAKRKILQIIPESVCFRIGYKNPNSMQQWQAVIPGTQVIKNSGVIVFVIYQPLGITESTFDMLKKLNAAGLSILCVVNGRVSEHDLKGLIQAAWKVILRENFGYDFGAYRAGVIYLEKISSKSTFDFDYVYFVNDSIRFKEEKIDETILQMRRKNNGLIAYTLANGHRKMKRHHVQSYFFLFKMNTSDLKDTFLEFWRNLATYNDRYLTIKNCEVYMTDFFRRKNFEISSIYDSITLRDIVLKSKLNIHPLKLSAEGKKGIGGINLIGGDKGQLQREVEHYVHNVIAAPAEIIYGILDISVIKVSANPAYKQQRNWLRRRKGRYFKKVLKELQSVDDAV